VKTRNRERRNMHNWLDRLEPRMLFSSATFPLPASPNWPTQNGLASLAIAGPQQSVWISDGADARIIKVRLNGAMTQYQVPNGGEAAVMTTGPDGNLWFYDDINNCFGRMTPSGEVREFAIPNSQSLQVTVDSMSTGPDKLLWFSGGTDAYSVMGTISKSGHVREWIPNNEQGAFGGFLTLASDGSLWSVASLAGHQPESLVRFKPDGGRQILPTNQFSSAGLAAGSKGSIWSDDFQESNIFHYFSDGHVESSNVQVSPNTILPARDGGAWFLYSTQDNPNYTELGKITPSGRFYEVGVPDNFIDILATGPDGNLWGYSLNSDAVARFDPKTSFLVHPRNISAQSGATQTYKLAIISNAPRTETPSEFTATVDWGDGTSGNAVVTRKGSHFVVSSEHNYSAGNWNATLTVHFAGATVESGSAINALLPRSSGSD